MKIAKVIASVGLAAALGLSMTGCTAMNYSGEGTVVGKEIDKSSKKSSSSSSKKSRSSSSKSTDYEITVDIPDSDVDRVIDVKKSQYDSIKVGQKVTIEKNKIK